MRQFALSVTFAVVLAVSAAADDAVEIKPPAPKAGARYKVTKAEKTKTVETLESGGKKTTKDKEETRLVVYTEEVLAPAPAVGEKPVKAVRVYEKYELKGAKDGSSPPLNAPITIAKNGDTFEFSADKPLGDFAKKLDEEFNKPRDEPTTKDFLPGKPVKPGDSWKIDPAKFVKSLGRERMNIDGAKAAMSGKLVKTYKKNGKLFGEFLFTADFPIKGLLGKDAPPLKSGAVKMSVTSGVCIDGTDNTESTKSQLGFNVVIETMGVTVTVTSDGTQSTTKEPLPQK